MNRRAYRRQWNRLKDKYESRAFKIVRKAIRETALSVPFDKLTVTTYPGYVAFYVGETKIKDAFEQMYLQTASAHGTRVGRGINKEIRGEKEFTPDSFDQTLQEFVARYLREFGGLAITSVRDNLRDYIIKYIADSVEKGSDIQTIARELERLIRSRGFYRWQIMRIVRTETTQAANYGAMAAMENSRLVYQKEWISATDSRTRRLPDDTYDHFHMDGVIREMNEKFEVPGKFGPDLLDYPGDTKGEPGNVINCRCTVAFVAKRDENGRLIRRNAPGPA